MTKNRQAKTYFHCGRCVSLRLLPNISVVINGTDLYVQCDTHRVVLDKFKLKEPMPHANGNPISCECYYCRQKNCRLNNLAIGVNATGTHLKSWCETHDIRLGMYELAEPIPPMRCAMCGKTGPHVH
jgi:hypothetical protein